MDTFHIYIHFPEHIINHISNTQTGIDFIEEFIMIIDLADCEKGSFLRYSNSNFNSFIESMDLIQEEKQNIFGNYSVQEVFSIVVQSAIDFDNNPLFESDDNKCYYKQWISANREPIDSEIIFKEIFERINLNGKTEKIILINMFEIDFKTKPIKIIKDCRLTQETTIKQFDYILSFNDLDEWLIKNRVKRNYNHNDNRHIENHPASLIVSKKKSPLIGGLAGKINAEFHLEKAIGDKNEVKDLMNFDDINNFYIWFEYENDNPQNQHHGYHLVSRQKPYQKDLDAESRIPSRVVKLLDYRKKKNCKK
jgi:hypothetical protein